MRRRLVVALAVLAVAAADPRAQAPAPAPPSQAPQPPTFRAGVGVVRVDVSVVDDDGEPVTDLTKDDFELREDGEIQKVQLFERMYLSGEPAAGSDASLVIRSPDHARQEAERDDVRLLVIFLDDYHIAYGPLEDTRLRRDLVRFVQGALKPTDLFAVMGPLTPISDLGLTRDSAELVKRINTLQGRLGGFVPPRSAIEQAHMQFGAGNLARIRAQVTLSALNALVVHLGGLREGRKSVLFVSQGPPPRVAGSDLYSEFQTIVAAANRNNVVIHTLDPRQLGAASQHSPANESLSSETGGRRMGLTNDFTRPLAGVMADASHYYLLGYEPPRQAADGRFHRLAVKVARRGVRVLARSGYWAPKAEEVYTAAAAAAAASSVPPDVTYALDQLKVQGRRTAVSDWVGLGAVNGTLRQATLIFEAIQGGGTPAASSVDVELITPDGNKVTRRPEGTGRGLWVDHIELPKGRTTVRTTVRDGKGDTIDSWSREIVLDDAASTASTPALYRITAPAQARALREGAAVTPSAVRRLRRTERAIVRWTLLEPGDANTIEAEIANRQGARVSRLTVARPVPGIAQVELPLAGLAQADYVLRLTEPRPAGAVSATLAFAIVP